MDRTLPGHAYAKSPIDIALWDIAGQCADQPLYQLLGGAEGDAVEANSSISTGTPEEMIALIEAARAEGYRTHSAKIGGTEPQTDITRIDAIEAARQPGEHITYDVNRAWTPAVAIEVMNAVSARGWFEQPCETLEQCVRVRRLTIQPIMLDECLLSVQKHAFGALDVGLRLRLIRPTELRSRVIRTPMRASIASARGSASRISRTIPHQARVRGTTPGRCGCPTRRGWASLRTRSGLGAYSSLPTQSHERSKMVRTSSAFSSGER